MGEIDIGHDSAISQSLIDQLVQHTNSNRGGDIPQELKDALIKGTDLDLKKFLPNLKSKDI